MGRDASCALFSKPRRVERSPSQEADRVAAFTAGDDEGSLRAVDSSDPPGRNDAETAGAQRRTSCTARDDSRRGKGERLNFGRCRGQDCALWTSQAVDCLQRDCSDGAIQWRERTARIDYEAGTQRSARGVDSSSAQPSAQPGTWRPTFAKMVLESGTAPRGADRDSSPGQEDVEFGVLSLAGWNAIRTAATATGSRLNQNHSGNRGDRKESLRGNEWMNAARISAWSLRP